MQLADLQFVGNRHTLEDIEKILCTSMTIKDMRNYTEPYGGIIGRLNILEDKIKSLENMISDCDSNMYTLARSVVKEHEMKCNHASTQITASQAYNTILTRDEVVEIAEQVVTYRLHNLRINFSY